MMDRPQPMEDLDFTAWLVVEQGKGTLPGVAGRTLTRAEVLQMIFGFEQTWPLIEPVFQAFWAEYPEARELHAKRLLAEDGLGEALTEGEEWMERHLMDLWEVDAACYEALAPLASRVDWTTGRVEP